jgi:hypothetical protein
MADLTKSSNVGVRWQAQMEEHLASVRGFSSEAALPGLSQEAALVRATLAQAHATAALALATALGDDS